MARHFGVGTLLKRKLNGIRSAYSLAPFMGTSNWYGLMDKSEGDDSRSIFGAQGLMSITEDD